MLPAGAGLTQVQAVCLPWQAQGPALAVWRGSRAGDFGTMLASVIGRAVLLLDSLATEPCPSHSQSSRAPTSCQVILFISVLLVNYFSLVFGSIT